MKVRPIVAWYDMWIGAFWDKPKRRLYLFPIPCVGLMIQFQLSKTEQVDPWESDDDLPV